MSDLSVKSTIIKRARDVWKHRVLPQLTGWQKNPASHKEWRRFRKLQDTEPFGFEHSGVSIEVHITHVRNILIPGTSRFIHVPVLLILGLSQKESPYTYNSYTGEGLKRNANITEGLTRVIAKGILAYE